MENNRVNKKVFLWDKALSKENWNTGLKSILSDLELENHWANNSVIPLELAKMRIQNRLERDWQHHCSTKDKLRTYRTFKADMNTAVHLNCNLPKFQRSLISQLRLGILPINIETGRYTGIPEGDSICEMCSQNRVENEDHFLFECDLYAPMRNDLEASIGASFDNMNVTEQFQSVFKHSYALGKFIEKSYSKRRGKLLR